MTPELETILQSFLLRKTQEWQGYCKEYPELALASYHVSPDGAWVITEHEMTEPGVSCHINDMPQAVRKSPACSQLITKI